MTDFQKKLMRISGKAKFYVVTFCSNGKTGDTARVGTLRKAKRYEAYFISKKWDKVRIIENKANLYLEEILENEQKAYKPVQLSLNF